MDKLIIEGGVPLTGVVHVSGSKNAALPILMGSILLDEPVTYTNVPDLRDIRTTFKLLELLGCPNAFENGQVTVTPGALSPEAPYELVKTMRASVLVLGPLLARLGEARVAMPGGCAIGARPVDLHLSALEKMGARFDLEDGYILGRCRKLNFSTDAAFRFERGVDFGTNAQHMEYVTRLVLEICGTSETRVGPVDDQIVNLPERKPVTMRVARCLKVVGMDIPVEAMHNTFTRLGFEYTFDGEVFTVQAPSHRFDIEIEEDLIEEVARLYGYEKLPDRPPLARIAMKSPKEASRTGHALRREMAVLGYQELINFSFVPEAWEKDFAGNDAPIRLLNPIASQLSVMRTQLVGGLVDILKYNLNRKAERVRVFELGRVFFPDPAVLDGPWSVKGVRQPSHIAGLAYGTASDVQWGVEARRVDFYDVKGDVERLVAPLKARFVKEVFPALHPGRSAAIYVGEKRVGFIGELHPKLVHEYGLPNAPVVFELEVEPLLTLELPRYTPVSKFQPMRRDVAVVVPADFEVQVLVDAVNDARVSDARLGALVSFGLFDLYRPKTDEGDAEKSLAFAVELNSTGEEALTDAEADATMQALVEVLERAGARLRA